MQFSDKFYRLSMDNDIYQHTKGVAMKRTPRELNTDFSFGMNIKKTPRELNTAYDLAQQKIVHLKTRNYCFDPISNIIQQWITGPTASKLENKFLMDESIPKRRQI